jgi:Protein of unknown function (DUF3592)
MSPAPRRVPLSLQIANFFNGIAQAGWFVFGFGMIFAWVFIGNADFSFVTFRGPHATTQGRVTQVEETGASENDVQVRRNHYEFSVAGMTHTGASYSTGASVATGESVTVEYDEDDPAQSRIEGLRRATFGPWLAFVGIFPLVGVGMFVPAILRGLKRNRLLREGLMAQGKLISKEPTNITINDRRLWELRYEFTARDGRRCEASARSTNTENLEDEATEPLLYDPGDPTRAFVLDEMPARPELEMNGELRGRPGRAIRALILPAIVLGAHGFVLYLKMT